MSRQQGNYPRSKLNLSPLLGLMGGGGDMQFNPDALTQTTTEGGVTPIGGVGPNIAGGAQEGDFANEAGPVGGPLITHQVPLSQMSFQNPVKPSTTWQKITGHDEADKFNQEAAKKFYDYQLAARSSQEQADYGANIQQKAVDNARAYQFQHGADPYYAGQGLPGPAITKEHVKLASNALIAHMNAAEKVDLLHKGLAEQEASDVARNAGPSGKLASNYDMALGAKFMQDQAATTQAQSLIQNQPVIDQNLRTQRDAAISEAGIKAATLSALQDPNLPRGSVPGAIYTTGAGLQVNPFALNKHADLSALADRALGTSGTNAPISTLAPPTLNTAPLTLAPQRKVIKGADGQLYEVLAPQVRH